MKQSMSLRALASLASLSNYSLAAPVPGIPPETETETETETAKAPASPAAAPLPLMPTVLSEQAQRPLLVAIASSYPALRQMERKGETGRVHALEPADIEANMDRARAKLASEKRGLAALSTSGLPNRVSN